MSGRVASALTTKVKPVVSVNRQEARRRVLQLYKAWHQQLLFIIKVHDLPISLLEGKAKIKEMFMKNKDVDDIRVIDMLVIKGQMELVEAIKAWKQKNHVMAYFRTTVEPKPKDFLERFFSGRE